MAGQQRFLSVAVLVIICIAAIVMGVIVALRITERNGSGERGSGSTVQFSQVEFGALETRRTQTTVGEWVLTQRSAYRLTDQLGLRVRVDSDTDEPIAATVRLVDQAGLVQPLDPSTITLEPGISGYCCWMIDTVGSYTLQLFRPDGTIVSLPLTVRAQ